MLQISKSEVPSKRPPIILIDSEAEVLTELALAMEERAPDVSEVPESISKAGSPTTAVR